MICPNCENKIPDKAKVCGHCGYRLKAGAPGTEPKRIREPVSAPSAAPGWRWGTIAGVGAIFCLVILAGAGYWLLKFRVPAANEPPAPSLAPTLPLPPAAAQSTQQTNCNAARFISDLNVPDGTTMTPGQTFTKSWRIKNVGTCTWTTDYLIVFSGGDRITGADSQALPGNVAPGQEVDLSVNLAAPEAEGNYIGEYALQDANGEKFIGFTVNISVQAVATPELFEVFWAFDDDIGETEFYEVENEACSFNFNSGEYHIVVKKTGWQCFPTTDFTLGGDGISYIGAKARIVEEIAYWSYGLIFGYNDIDNYYDFQISRYGEYRLRRKINGEWEALIDWTQSEYVNSGNAANDMFVRFTDTQIVLYINGNRVDSYSDDDRMPAGGVGVIVGTGDSPNVHVAFDYFQAGEEP